MSIRVLRSTLVVIDGDEITCFFFFWSFLNQNLSKRLEKAFKSACRIQVSINSNENIECMSQDIAKQR